MSSLPKIGMGGDMRKDERIENGPNTGDAETRESALEQQLRRVLQLRHGSADTLKNRESVRIEFKTSFNFRSMPEYTRTIAAFSNNRGGFIIFGVEPSPHRLRGVNQAFERIDVAKITTFLRTHLSPEVEWVNGSIVFHDCDLGYLWTPQARERPVVVTRDAGTEIKEGDIFYRYRGQSTRIRFAELRQILDERIERERKAWMQHLQAISSAGPTNVGVLDTVGGELRGVDSTYLIDESLLRQLRFIREGRFSSTGGEPTLKVIGDVTPVGGVVAERRVPVGIHERDILEAFLTDRDLSRVEAKHYLAELAHQSSPFQPVFFFAAISELPYGEVEELLKADQSRAVRKTALRILKRLNGAESVPTMGVVKRGADNYLVEDCKSLLQHLDGVSVAGEARSVLLTGLTQRPAAVLDALGELPIMRLCEAMTHVSADQARSNKSAYKEILLTILLDRYAGLAGNEKGAYRKAVAYLVPVAERQKLPPLV